MYMVPVCLFLSSCVYSVHIVKERGGGNSILFFTSLFLFYAVPCKPVILSSISHCMVLIAILLFLFTISLCVLIYVYLYPAIFCGVKKLAANSSCNPCLGGARVSPHHPRLVDVILGKAGWWMGIGW